MTSGYQEDWKEILSKQFTEPYDEMVVVTGIEFHSLCEHHLMPFSGTAAVAYLPDKRVVGLSKIPRLVHCFAKRLQIQERLTSQITTALLTALAATGAGCIIKAQHSCMKVRGVRCSGNMTTSSLLGSFRQTEVKSEFLELIK